MSLQEEVLDVISLTLDVEKDELNEDERLYDSIGVDSTEVVEIIVTLNKKMGVKIETNEITKFSTPNEILTIIEKKKRDLVDEDN